MAIKNSLELFAVTSSRTCSAKWEPEEWKTVIVWTASLMNRVNKRKLERCSCSFLLASSTEFWDKNGWKSRKQNANAYQFDTKCNCVNQICCVIDASQMNHCSLLIATFAEKRIIKLFLWSFLNFQRFFWWN